MEKEKKILRNEKEPFCLSFSENDILENDTDSLSLSYEVSQLMVSFEMAKPDISDEDLYDYYLKQKESIVGSPLSKEQFQQNFVRHDRSLAMASQKAKRSSKKFASLPISSSPRRSLSLFFLLFAGVFLFASILSYTVAIVIKKVPSPSVSKTSDVVSPIKIPQKTQVISPKNSIQKLEKEPFQNREEQNNIQEQSSTSSNSVKQPSPMIDFLEKNRSTPQKMARGLFKLVQGKKLSLEDIPILQQLYIQSENDLALRRVVIWCMGEFKNEVTLPWLREIAATSIYKEVERLSAIKAIEAIQNADAREILSSLLSQEENERIVIAIMTSMAKLSPKDDSLFQKFSNKFLQSDNSQFRLSMLSILKNMQLKQVSLFFCEIISQTEYTSSIRMEALQSLTVCPEIADEVIPKLSQMQANNSDTLQEKIRQALQILYSKRLSEK